MDKIDLLIKLIKDIFVKKWTGQLRLNFYKGNLSENIDRKEKIKIK